MSSEQRSHPPHLAATPAADKLSKQKEWDQSVWNE